MAQPKAERLNDIIDLYKLQIEELDKHYDGMRTLFWRITVQVYAVYLVIPIALGRLDPKFHSWQLAVLAIASTVILYGCASYASFRIVVRLIYYGEMPKAYLGSIYRLLGVPELASPDIVPYLGHQYIWTYVIQQLLGTAIVLGLLDYELALESILRGTLVVSATVALSLLMIAVLLCLVNRLKYSRTETIKMAEEIRRYYQNADPNPPPFVSGNAAG
jgi:hypothetical protein